jgi:hypothetical protein
VLKNILHVPNATKNMLSIHQFTTDNRASLEYFPFFFWSRTWTRGELFLEGGVAMDSTHSLPSL